MSAVLETRGLCKSFGALTVADRIDFRLEAGARHALIGPNGAGKTTFALRYLPQVAPGSAFINADLIAAGLSPLAPEQQTLAASRLFLQQIERHIAEGREIGRAHV